MDTKHFERKLREKERDLVSGIATLESEGANPRAPEVEDTTDEAVASEEKSEAFGEADIRFRTLELVRDALLRIEQGTYGRCLDCDRDIEPARLEAVPWAQYCKADQEKREQA